MPSRQFVLRRIPMLIVLSVILVLTALIIVGLRRVPRQAVFFGASFSPAYARYLGLDARAAFKRVIGEWGFTYVRLPVDWDDLEPLPGQVRWDEIDWYMDEAGKAGVKVVLVIGQKTPRWPECHLPSWLDSVPQSEHPARLAGYMRAVVERYRTHPALDFWQVENEPFLAFGKCPPTTVNQLHTEIEAVQQLDSQHLVLVSDSGELSLWRKTARAADLFGTTVYRTVWNKRLGYFKYDWLPAAWYRLRLAMHGREAQTAYVMELQAEPWIPNSPIAEVPLKEQYRSFNLARFDQNVAYARAIGFPRAYLWGAEWWFWLEQNYGLVDFGAKAAQLPKGK